MSAALNCSCTASDSFSTPNVTHPPGVLRRDNLNERRDTMRVSIVDELERLGARRVRRDHDDEPTTITLSESDLIAAGHSAEDARRVVEAERDGTLVVELAESLDPFRRRAR